MANTYADRVQETSTTTGTGTYDLAGPTTGYQGFVAGAGDAATVTYLATDGTNWEVGTGVVTDAATDTLSRASILSSSNAGSAVNWGAGTKTISLTLPASAFDNVEKYPKYAFLSDTKASGTDGGGSTLGAWRTRDLNTEDYDPDGIVSVSTNQFTLQAGTYRIQARAPTYRSNRNKIRLQNITDATTPLIGASAYTAVGDYPQTDATLDGVITIASAKVFEIQYQCTSSQTGIGLGIAASYAGASEIYTQVKIVMLTA